MGIRAKLVVKDHGWDAMMQHVADLARLKHARVKVGVLADSAKGAAREKDGPLTVAEIAAVLHFGTQDGHIPPRPFLTMTFDAKREELKELGAKCMAGVIVGAMTLDNALNVLGAKLAADVKATIVAGVPPPNAPSTALAKAMKGRTAKHFKKPARNLGQALAQVGALASVKALIDTGRLLNAITWQIDK